MPQKSKKLVDIDNMMVNNATTKAKIRWVLSVVCSRYSKNSLSNVNGLFTAMFPDSEIAKSFQYSPTKASYVTTYSLAPYFHSLLLQKISFSPRQVVSFDESLNYSVQKPKMDLLIRYRDNDRDRVCSHYMGSEFMGRSTADDVLETFQNGTSEVNKSKVMLVSYDGPNVYLAFLKKYASVREEKELDPIMDLGTCGLHLVHGSVKAGAKASEWELQKLLKTMWQFIHYAPARRTMYENISESTYYRAKWSPLV